MWGTLFLFLHRLQGHLGFVFILCSEEYDLKWRGFPQTLGSWIQAHSDGTGKGDA